MPITERPVWSSFAWPIAAAVLLGLALSVMLLGPDLGSAVLAWTLSTTTVAAVAVAVWALLRTRSQRRAHERRLESWAAERAVQEERLRIARELHDLASHGLGLMTVRAAYANLADDDDCAERGRALADIERAGRAATDELRQMLSLLRGASGQPAPLRPVSSLAELPAIVGDAERSGLRVTSELLDLDEPPAALQATVCAVVREGLANTARHAGPTAARLLVDRTGRGIRVDLSDDGPVPGWRPQRGAGHGIAGLRERLALHGGRLTVGGDGDGFRLLAEIPAGGEER